MTNDTPRTSAALGATLEAGWDLGPQHRALTELCRELERENAMLRTGDTCARQCEGTAYRIEGRRVRHHLTELAKFADRAAMVLATIEAEDTTEEQQLQDIIDGIMTWAPPAILGTVTANVEGEGPPERRSRGGNREAQLLGGPSRPAG